MTATSAKLRFDFSMSGNRTDAVIAPLHTNV